jgi:putative flippase GtrA
LKSLQRSDAGQSKSETGLRQPATLDSLFRIAKFAAGSAVGFLDTEVILATGTFALYGRLSAPQSAFYSTAFWFLNIIAFVIGVSVAFFVNESLLLRNGDRKISYDLKNTLRRLTKFQLIFLAGNLVMIGIQMVLLKKFSIPPIGGNVIGSIVSFPISYFFSVHFVWQTKDRKSLNPPRMQHIDEMRTQFPQFRMHQSKEQPDTPILTGLGKYNLILHDYKLDLEPSGESETDIDFSLRMDLLQNSDLS